MGSPLLGKQTSSLVVLHDEARTNEELLCDLAHGSWRKAECRCDDVQSRAAIADDFQVLLLGRVEPQFVDALQFARSPKLIFGDRGLTFGTTNSAGRLK